MKPIEYESFALWIAPMASGGLGHPGKAAGRQAPHGPRASEGPAARPLTRRFRPCAATIAVMDRLDREILGILQEDARISYRDLGVRVGLSANAAGDRVRRMRRDGVIRGFTVIVDPAADTRSGLVVFIDVSLRLDTTNEEFERSVLTLPGITEVVHVTGGHDYLVRATAADPGSLDALLRRLKKDAGVAHSNTRIALRAAPAR